MDELTAERFGPGVPFAEARRKPRRLKPKIPQSVIDARREILCGTADLAVMEMRAHALAEHRRLAETIRTVA
jgi:hypothetical protein